LQRKFFTSLLVSFLLPQKGVVLDLHRTTASQNCCSYQLADKQAERSYYNDSDAILCVK